jgi:hypothetical protein
MFQRNEGVPAERRQTFRIGLHLGDVIASDDDVFGDTVNLAARLQGVAEPGALVVSAAVYEQVRDKLALPFRDLGNRSVKNIDRPIHVYTIDHFASAEGAPAPSRPRPSKRMAAGVAAVASGLLALAGGLAYFSGHLLPAEEAVAAAPAPIETGLSVAVLVFANQSGDPGQDYFSDGADRGHHACPGPLQAAHRAFLRRGAAVPRKERVASGDRACAPGSLHRGRDGPPHGTAGACNRAVERCHDRHTALVRAL